MRVSKLILLALLLAFPGLAPAAGSGIPTTSTWYFHADFGEMRGSDAGKPLYGWLQREVFEDIRDDAGIDLDQEADSITAFAADESGTVVVVDGKIRQETMDKLLALAATSDEMQTFSHKGKTFYFTADDEDRDIEIDNFDDGVFFSFAIKNRILATSNLEQMESLLASNGKLPKRSDSKSALIVLEAEKSLIQAGMQADQIEDDGDGGWESNILRNTDQVAVLVADMAGRLAVETQLIAKEPEMAESLASIVRGLISLTMFSDDMDPEVSQFLKNTTVAVDGSALSIKLSLDPDALIAVIDD